MNWLDYLDYKPNPLIAQNLYKSARAFNTMTTSEKMVFSRVPNILRDFVLSGYDLNDDDDDYDLNDDDDDYDGYGDDEPQQTPEGSEHGTADIPYDAEDGIPMTGDDENTGGDKKPDNTGGVPEEKPSASPAQLILTDEVARIKNKLADDPELLEQIKNATDWTHAMRLLRAVSVFEMPRRAYLRTIGKTVPAGVETDLVKALANNAFSPQGRRRARPTATPVPAPTPVPVPVPVPAPASVPVPVPVPAPTPVPVPVPVPAPTPARTRIGGSTTARAPQSPFPDADSMV